MKVMLEQYGQPVLRALQHKDRDAAQNTFLLFKHHCERWLSLAELFARRVDNPPAERQLVEIFVKLSRERLVTLTDKVAALGAPKQADRVPESGF
jgi:hypothetical protein